MLDNQNLLTVTDIKQYHYCPRIVFYERCLPHIRPRTYKMDVGRDAHEDEQKRAVRRTLSKYEVSGGKRQFDVAFVSETLQLTGSVDEIVHTDSGEVFPVDYKLAKKVSANHRLQLTAYALLLEEVENISIQRGFIYLMLNRTNIEIAITDSLRDQVKSLLSEILLMIREEVMPLPTIQRAHCMNCEFRLFCNDI